MGVRPFWSSLAARPPGRPNECVALSLQYYPCVEVAVKQCRNGGIDCKVRALSVVGRRRVVEDPMPRSFSFLAAEAKDLDWSEAPSRVFVWGLNDKDQLGGAKGSKVKLPVFSETLSALRPVHIAGGSKTLFVVSSDGKVRSCDNAPRMPFKIIEQRPKVDHTFAIL